MDEIAASAVKSAPGSERPNDIFRRFAQKFPPHIVFLILGGINAILLCFLTPPFQVPDEFQHFFRSYQLSEGRLWGTVEDGRAGGQTPLSLQELVASTWGTLEVQKVPPLGRHPLSSVWSRYRQPLQASRKRFAWFITADYSPLMYIPQTAAIAVGRMADAAPIMLLTLGRLANAIFAVAAIAWALKILPAGSEMALAIALFPMAQFEYGSVAPDATIIASGYLLTAILLTATRQAKWPAVKLSASVVAAGILGAKVVYAPLFAIAAPALFRWRNTARPLETALKAALPHLLMAVLAVGLTVLWLKSSAAASAATTAHAAMASKIAGIGAHPLRFTALLFTDLRSHLLRYVLSAIGVLGHWTIVLPNYVYVLAIVSIVLAISVQQDVKDVHMIDIVWCLMLAFVVFVLVQTALYVTFASPEGFRENSGVQGRYFLPLGALVAATAGSAKGMMPKSKHPTFFLYALLIAILFVDTLSLDATIITHFHLF